MWRPAEGWVNPHKQKRDTLTKNQQEHTFLGKHGKYLEKAFEAGADAMHRADLQFLETNFPDVIFRMKATMTKEEWENFSR